MYTVFIPFSFSEIKISSIDRFGTRPKAPLTSTYLLFLLTPKVFKSFSNAKKKLSGAAVPFTATTPTRVRSADSLEYMMMNRILLLVGDNIMMPLFIAQDSGFRLCWLRVGRS